MPAPCAHCRSAAARLAPGLTILLLLQPAALAQRSVDPASILKAARRLCLSIRSAQSRAAALAEVALRLEATDPRRAGDLWALSLECAISVEDPLARVRTRCAVAKRMLRSSLKAADAPRYLADILAAASKLPVAPDRAAALTALYPLLVSAKSPDAGKALEAATQAALKIPEPLVRAAALASIASALAATDRTRARTIADKAEQAWATAPAGVERDLAAAELVRAWATIDFDHALELAARIDDVQAKAQAFQAAASQVAPESIAAAVAAAGRIAPPELRLLALTTVAAHARPRPHLAAALARDALRAAVDCPTAIRDHLAAAAAQALAPTDAQSARSALRSISDEMIRARATARVAQALAPAAPAAAAQLLSDCDHPELAEPAWPEVLFWYAKQDPARAVSLTESILERYIRVKALVRIWDALTGPGPSSSTRTGA